MRLQVFIAILVCFYACDIVHADNGPLPKDKALSSDVRIKSKRGKKPKTVLITRETMREMKYKLLPLDTISYATVEVMVRPILSDKGIMTYEQKRNSILIYDYPEVIEKVKAFLKEADAEAVNIRIDVDYIGAGDQTKSGANMTWHYGKQKTGVKFIYKDGKWVKPDKVSGDIYYNKTKTSRHDSTFIMTKSGYPASLWVGKTIVDPSWLNNMPRGVIVVVPINGKPNLIDMIDVDFKWADVGAALEVLPIYNPNGTITVEVYPRISYLDGKGKRQAVKVESLSTKITVKEGQRFNIGGLIEGNRKTFTSVFGPDFFKRDDFSNVLDMYLTATAMTPAGTRKSDGAGQDKSGKRIRDLRKRRIIENPHQWR